MVSLREGNVYSEYLVRGITLIVVTTHHQGSQLTGIINKPHQLAPGSRYFGIHLKNLINKIGECKLSKKQTQ